MLFCDKVVTWRVFPRRGGPARSSGKVSERRPSNLASAGTALCPLFDLIKQRPNFRGPSLRVIRGVQPRPYRETSLGGPVRVPAGQWAKEDPRATQRPRSTILSYNRRPNKIKLSKFQNSRILIKTMGKRVYEPLPTCSRVPAKNGCGKS